MSEKGNAIISLFMLIIILGALVGGMMLYPRYKIYKLEMSGKAALAEAEWSKKIQIEEAKGRLEAAKFDRERELMEANTTAETNMIVSGSLDPLYLQYLMINRMIDGNTQQIIYLPTEAGIPQLEAGRATQTAPTV